MDIAPCGSRWAEQAMYTDWYPRVVAAAHRLVARKGLGWAPNSHAFRLLVREGCEAASGALAGMRGDAPDAWVKLPRTVRIRVAVRTASRAMARYLQVAAPAR